MGCPTWKESAQRLGAAPIAAGEVPPLQVYVFGTDAGPDNIGAFRRVREDLRDATNVLFVAVFCFLHQAHLIVRDLLNHLDSFNVGLLGGSSGRRYWSSVATVANQWRSTGVPKKVRRAAEEVHGAGSTAAGAYRKLPGKPLRGRWGSIAAVEQSIIECGPEIGKVFAKALGITLEEAQERDAKKAAAAKAKGGAKAKPAADPKPNPKKRRKVGDEEAESYRRAQREYRATTIVCTSDAAWLATVQISAKAKEPLSHYTNWCLKAKKEYAQNLAAAAPRPYLGPTPLSQLVCTKARQVESELQDLLSDEHCTGVWAPVWQRIPPAEQPQFRLLIVTLVLRALAGWRARMVQRTEKFPLALLRLVEGGFATTDGVHVDARSLREKGCTAFWQHRCVSFGTSASRCSSRSSLAAHQNPNQQQQM